MKIYFQ